jgi:sigma-E factor negative regulatory protein RseB
VISLRRAATVVLVSAAVAVAGGVGVGAETSAAEPTATDRNVGRLDAARQLAQQLDYDGTVFVWWRDDAGAARDEVIGVHAAGGTTTIGEESYLAPEPGSLVYNGQSFVASKWKAGAPRADDKYSVLSAPGGIVAGEVTTILEARRDADSRLVERFWISNESGLVLRRDSFDENEVRRRSSGFESIAMATGAAASGEDVTLEHATEGEGPRVVSEVEPPYHDPSSAGNGFRLVARWEHPNDVVQLSYSDGLLTASVFEERGRLNWDRLPRQGRPGHVNGDPAVAYSLPQGEVLVWERAGIVYTAVSDAPSDELFALAGSVSRHGQNGALARLARMVLSPFRW